ncbi:hypothetical protein L0222_14180 [bacterium]|nr:hypothetical protein [bacterium]MCI0604432.1 hypothetical protein [bacterium]
MKILYILAVLMLIGIVLIFLCSMKVLNDLSAVSNPRRSPRVPRFRQQQEPAVKPKTQIYVIGTYLGLTFFIVGGAGSILVLFQAMRRG